MTKKLLLIVAILFNCSFAACNEEKVVDPGNTPSTEVTTTTREVILNCSRMDDVPVLEDLNRRHIIEVYEFVDANTLGTLFTREVSQSNTFLLEDLDPMKKYTILAWVDYTDATTDEEYYTTSPLTAVTKVSSRSTVNSYKGDAMSGSYKGVIGSNQPLTINLQRPVAMVNVKTVMPSAHSASMEFEALHTSYNVFQKDVAGASAAIKVEGKIVTGKGHVNITDYVFVGYSQELLDITYNAYDATNTSLGEEIINDAQIFSNYKTVIDCDLLSSAAPSVTQVNDMTLEADFRELINCSYIRTDFFQTGQVDIESINACNDLIILLGSPNEDGSIGFVIPDNQASTTNVSYLDGYAGRTGGIASFNGTGATMNGGHGLIQSEKSSEPSRTFAFGGWFYLEEWTAGATIFSKVLNGDEISLKLGASEGSLVFRVKGGDVDKSVELNASTFTTKAWKHLSIGFDGRASSTSNKLSVAVAEPGMNYNTQAIVTSSTALDSYTTIPNIKSEIIIGTDLNAKVDNLFASRLGRTDSSINTGMSDSGYPFSDDYVMLDYNTTGVLAYWKFDNSSNLGLDSRTWKQAVAQIRAKAPTKGYKFGVISGDYKLMLLNSASQDNFVDNLVDVVKDNGFEGVDFDLEWIEHGVDANATTLFAGYSDLIVKTGTALKAANSDYVFSVSLIRSSYSGITQEAIDAADFITVQTYGPRTHLFGLDNFMADVQTFLNFGVPREKLVMGVPFYGVDVTNSGATQAYKVLAGQITSPDQNEVTYNGITYLFDGQDLMKQKVEHIREQELAGIMSWDLATDLPFNSNMSLLRTIYEN